jgi:DHA1 family tetracycline resistance protein-like MFS transporter
MGAADAAFYHGWSDAVSNIAAMALALGNGSYSDAIGRRPLIRISATLWLSPLVFLAFYMFTGLTLWVYLLLVPLLLIFDLNGVYMALMSDLIPKAEERATAFGLFMAIMMITSGVVMPIAFLIPKNCALAVSLTAAALRLLYLFTIFPETAPLAIAPEERNGILATARLAFKVLTRHNFIFRMTLVLTLSGLGASGYAIVMPPFMTGYLGFERKHKLMLFMACGASMAFAFLVLLGPLTAFFGDVGVLKISLTAAVMFPVLCSLCSKIWHLVVLAGLFAGPLSMAYPMVMAIKSNLVAQDEQGLVQGAIASIGRGTATVGFVFFSIFFKIATQGGEIKDNAVLIGPFLAIGCINVFALLLAFSLPKVPPPPPNKVADSPGNELAGA